MPKVGILPKTLKIKKSIKNAAKLKKLKTSPATSTYTNLFNPGTNPDLCERQPGVPIQMQKGSGVRKLDRDWPDVGDFMSAGPIVRDAADGWERTEIETC